MIAIGLLLFVLSALLTAGLALFNSDPSNASAFGVTLSNVSIGGLFLTGVITGVVGTLGLVLLVTGSARKRHQKVAAKREIKSARTEAATLAEQNVRLQGQLQDTTPQPDGSGRPTEGASGSTVGAGSSHFPETTAGPDTGRSPS